MIVNFGSLNIDYVYSVDRFANPGETILANEMQVFAGGKGLNQSVAIARAGGEVVHAGVYGFDGDMLKDTLCAEGIDTHCLRKVEKPNGHAIIQVNSSGENSIILYPGSNQLLDEKTADRVLNEVDNKAIILLQNETSSVDYIIKKAKQLGLKVAINPAPITREVNEYRLDVADYLFLNRSEGESITKKAEISDIIDSLKSMFTKTKVILTLGAEGLYFISDGEHSKVPAVKVDNVLDTTAAGDTLIGYYLSLIMQGSEDIEALKLATKASALCVTRFGAASSIPYIYEIV